MSSKVQNEIKLPENLKIRPIECQDYLKQYLVLVNQLSPVYNMNNYNEFCYYLNIILKSHGHIIVIEDIDKNKIIATGSIWFDFKIARGFSTLGRIEDVVVDKNYRGKNIGKFLINHLKDLGKNCYKIRLVCNDQNEQFYVKCGFDRVGVEMNIKNMNFK